MELALKRVDIETLREESTQVLKNLRDLSLQIQEHGEDYVGIQIAYEGVLDEILKWRENCLGFVKENGLNVENHKIDNHEIKNQEIGSHEIKTTCEAIRNGIVSLYNRLDHLEGAYILLRGFRGEGLPAVMDGESIERDFRALEIEREKKLRILESLERDAIEQEQRITPEAAPIVPGNRHTGLTIGFFGFGVVLFITIVISGFLSRG